MAQNVGFLQAVREHQLLVAKELVGWTVGNDGALIQHDRPGTQLTTISRSCVAMIFVAGIDLSV